MPYLVGLRRTIRKWFLITVILAVLLHEPAFAFALKVFINAHILSRLVFTAVRHFISINFPAFATSVIEVYHRLHQHVASTLEATVQATVEYVGHATMAWLEKSPGYLCEINTWIANTGEQVAKKWMVADAEVITKWLGATKEAADFCLAILGESNGNWV